MLIRWSKLCSLKNSFRSILKNVEQRDGYTQIKKKLLDEGKSFLTTNSDLIQILESQIQIPDND